jgi:hypothetical protein
MRIFSPRLFITAACSSAIICACHFFEHPNDIDNPIERCPLNEGYPCPCDATRPNGATCDDGTICLYGTDPSRGFCSLQCDDIDQTAQCDQTDLHGYGVTGLCSPIGDTTSPGQCIIACEYGGVTGECPPGLACEREAVDGFKACLPITQGDPDPDTIAARDECSAFCRQFTQCLKPDQTLEQCTTNCVVDDWQSNECARCWLLCSGSDSCDTFNPCISACRCGK